jgi:hypothetical protein
MRSLFVLSVPLVLSILFVLFVPAKRLKGLTAQSRPFAGTNNLERTKRTNRPDKEG